MPRISVTKIARRAAVAVGALLGLVVVAVLAASVVLQGPRLGGIIEGTLPAFRGQLQIGGVSWSLRALGDLVTDEPSPISVDGLRIVDPEGTVVLDVPHLEARVKLRTLIAGSFSIHDLKAGKALWRFAQMKNTDEIGFLAALAPKGSPPPPPEGTPKPKPDGDKPGGFFHIVNADLGDLNAIFDFPGAWGLELRQARATASLIQSAVDPKHPVFGFDAGPVIAAGGGWLRIMDDNLLPFDTVSINRVSTTPDRPNDIFLDLREAKSGRSTLVGKGYFTGIYGLKPGVDPGIDLHAEFRDAGDAFGRVAAGKQIPGLVVGGDGATATLDLREPFAAMKVDARFTGLDVAFGDYRALDVGFGLGFDGGEMKVAVRDFTAGAPGGGQLALTATLDARRLKLGADVRLKAFTTDSFLPPPLQRLVGGVIDGRLHADADLNPALGARGPSVAVRGLDLTLNRRRAGGLPKTIRVKGDTTLSPARAKTAGLTVEIPGATARAEGEMQLARQTVALGLEVVASDLARVLVSLGLPPLGKDARLTLRVDGPLASPTASGEARVRGLSLDGKGKGSRHVLPEVVARFGLEGGVARIDSLSGALFGGRIDARGTAKLYEKTTRRMLKSPIVDLSLALRDVDVGAASGSDVVAGRLSLDAHVTGTADAPTVTVGLPGVAPLTVAGQALALGPVDAILEGRTLTVRRLRIVRKQGGGTVEVMGTVGLDGAGALALDVDVRGVGLAGLPGVAEAGVPLTGTVAAKLEVGGTFDRPTVAGTVDLAGVVVRGIRLGDGRVALATAASGAIEVKGDLFGRLQLDGQVALGAAGPSVHGTVSFEKMALETLLPALVTLGEGKGLASGRVQVDIEPGKPLAADVLLRELWVSLARAVDAAPGEPTTRRVQISAIRPIHVTVSGDKVTLEETRLGTTGGTLDARATLDGSKLTGEVNGHLDLELVQPFLRSPIENVSGDLKVALTASGTLQAPVLRGQVTVGDPVHVRPSHFDSDVVVGSGTIALEPGRVEVKSLAVTVDGATTRLDGKVTLGAGFQPEIADVKLGGEVSARLLAYLAGEAVSDAQGRARVRAEVHGRVDRPSLNAWLGLGTITFRLRDTGTQVEVHSGVVEVSNSGALLRDVRVTLNDQGKLLIGAAGVRPGQVEFRSLVPFELGEIDFPLHGEQIAYRSPDVFELNELAFDFDLQGEIDTGFTLGGEVRIIAGRYVQDFEVASLVLRPRVNESGVRPFYADLPLLRDLELDLTVRTVGDAFVVQNNIAPAIYVDVALQVGGTLSEPTLAGDVRPTDGRFHIPGLRGEFDLVPNVNHVIFVDTKSVADGDTPEINIEAQNLVVDSSGIEHMARMRIRGPAREMQIDLSTDGGLDRAQTAMLLLTGRTTSASDRQSAQNPTVGGNVRTGVDVAGQVTRDTIANLMDPIIGDTFERVIGAQLRLTVGPDGFEGRVRKRLSRYSNVQADALFGFQGQSRQSAQLNFWLADYFTLAGGIQRLTLSPQQGLNQTLPTNYNVELRWDWAIRM